MVIDISMLPKYRCTINNRNLATIACLGKIILMDVIAFFGSKIVSGSFDYKLF